MEILGRLFKDQTLERQRIASLKKRFKECGLDPQGVDNIRDWGELKEGIDWQTLFSLKIKTTTEEWVKFLLFQSDGENTRSFQLSLKDKNGSKAFLDFSGISEVSFSSDCIRIKIGEEIFFELQKSGFFYIMAQQPATLNRSGSGA